MAGRRKRAAKRWLIAAGTIILLFGVREKLVQTEQEQYGQESVWQILQENEVSTVPPVEQPEETPQPTPVTEEAVCKRVLMDDYLCLLEIPSEGLKLPVWNEWSYVRLDKAPCREKGSIGNDDLVIAGHNYDAHFGKLDSLKTGDSVILTEYENEPVEYSVCEVRIMRPTMVEEVLHSDYDLVLYTCTPGGRKRCVVFCDKV